MQIATVFPGTCAARFEPQTIGRRLMYQIALLVAGSLLIAASARIAIPLPFSPVPVTGQTFAVLLIGALLGSRLGAATVLAYLAQGAAGLPVFAGGMGGIAWMLRPTGGYLLGFLPAAWIVGLLAERGWDRRPTSTAAAMTFGLLAVYLVGVPWLMFFVGPAGALTQGLLPFIPGAVVKVALAAAMMPLGWAALTRLESRWLRDASTRHDHHHTSRS